MTPVVGISSIMFHGYNDDLGTLDDVINGVGKIRYSAKLELRVRLISRASWRMPSDKEQFPSLFADSSLSKSAALHRNIPVSSAS